MHTSNSGNMFTSMLLFRKTAFILSFPATLFGSAFLLNFTWEALHGVYLYKAHNMRAVHYVPMLIYVSAVDGLLITGVYGLVSILRRDMLWLRSSSLSDVSLFGLSAIVLAAGIEIRAVYLLNRWDYLPTMPTVFGIGLSPLLQLAATGCIALALVKRLFFPACLKS